jgi:hypothetical protein
MSERDDGKVWIDCPQCGGEGAVEGECDCMDDTCCCLDPTPPDCGWCRGNGGYFVPADSAAARDQFRCD